MSSSPRASTTGCRSGGCRFFDGKVLQVVDLDPVGFAPLHATAVRLFDEPVRGVLAAQGQWVVVAAQSSTRRGSARKRAPSSSSRWTRRGSAGHRPGGPVPGWNLNPPACASTRRASPATGSTSPPPSRRPWPLSIWRFSRRPWSECWLPLAGALAAVAVRDGVAYVAAGDAGLHVVRVTVPEEAAEIGTVGAGEGRRSDRGRRVRVPRALRGRRRRLALAVRHQQSYATDTVHLCPRRWTTPGPLGRRGRPARRGMGRRGRRRPLPVWLDAVGDSLKAGEWHSAIRAQRSGPSYRERDGCRGGYQLMGSLTRRERARGERVVPEMPL